MIMMKPALFAIPFALALATVPFTAAGANAAPLPGLGADLEHTSVSGLSSGGFMAAQIATAYSSAIKGVAVIAGGPFDCASTYPEQSPLQNAVTACMQPVSAATTADAAVSWRNAQRYAQEGLIDPVANLARQRVYVFSGTEDRTVRTSVVDQVEKYYRLAGVAPAAIVYSKNIAAGHAILTDRPEDGPCAATQAPYINNCGFTQSHDLLRQLAGPGSQPPNLGQSTGHLIRFDQGEFLRGSRNSMDDVGYAYVPLDCLNNACAVHVVFHGCQQGATRIGARFYAGTGYNQYADTNRLIVLYPQVRASNGIPVNPQGCWDFWGYSGDNASRPDFQTRQAPQMAAVMAMVRRLGQARATPR